MAGRNFHHVTNIWNSQAEDYKGAAGYSEHEVSTISPSGAWMGRARSSLFNPRDMATTSGDSFISSRRELEPGKLATAPHRDLAALDRGCLRPFVNLSK